MIFITAVEKFVYDDSFVQNINSEISGTQVCAVIVQLARIGHVVATIPLRLGIALLLHPMLGADAIWLSFPASSLVTLILTLIYYRYGGWREARIAVPPAPHPAPEGLQPSP